MKHSKKILAFILCLVTLFIAVGCGASETNTPSVSTAPAASDAAGNSDAAVADKEYRFAFAVKNQTNPFFINMVAGMQEACDEVGVTLTVQATETDKDLEKQNQILQTFLTQQYDAILVTPLSASAIVPFVKSCNDAGIPIILIDTNADADELAKVGATVNAYVTGDNYDAGVKAAESMVEVLEDKGDIAILESTAGSSAGIAVLDGAKSILDESGLNVVASQTADNNRNKGYDVAQSILTANPAINGILACNDEMALGAIRALEDMQIEGVKVVGINNAPDAQTAIKEGKMYATVDKRSSDQGATAVQRALDILAGKEVEAEEYLDCKLIKLEDLQ